jgi:hypothetical protein
MQMVQQYSHGVHRDILHIVVCYVVNCSAGTQEGDNGYGDDGQRHGGLTLCFSSRKLQILK